jgi:hypothetical protein
MGSGWAGAQQTCGAMAQWSGSPAGLCGRSLVALPGGDLVGGGQQCSRGSSLVGWQMAAWQAYWTVAWQNGGLAHLWGGGLVGNGLAVLLVNRGVEELSTS